MHPNQFQVNEAWIVFKLNDIPVRTAQDGSFNCVCLMDAASCYLLSNTFVPIHEPEPPQSDVRRLFEAAWQQKQEFPEKLFVPVGQFQTNIPEEAEFQGIEVVCVPEGQLAVFIGEAKEAYKEYMEQNTALNSPGSFNPSLN